MLGFVLGPPLGLGCDARSPHGLFARLAGQPQSKRMGGDQERRNTMHAEYGSDRLRHRQPGERQSHDQQGSLQKIGFGRSGMLQVGLAVDHVRATSRNTVWAAITPRESLTASEA